MPLTPPPHADRSDGGGPRTRLHWGEGFPVVLPRSPLERAVGPLTTLALVVLALARGSEYVLAPPSVEPLAFLSVLGLDVWGYGFCAVGVLLLATLLTQQLTRVVAPLFFAHAVACVLWVFYDAALLITAVDTGQALRVPAVDAVVVLAVVERVARLGPRRVPA